MRLNGCKVFTVTKIRERQELDRVVNGWLRHHPDITILDYKVTQSSDDAFHCVTIILFFHDPNFV